MRTRSITISLNQNNQEIVYNQHYYNNDNYIKKKGFKYLFLYVFG